MPPMGPRSSGPRRPGMPVVGNKPKDVKKTLKRLLSYLPGTYKVTLVVVIICILLSTLAGVIGSLFLKVLIDDYITPLLGMENPVFTALLQAILFMGLIYLCGVISTLIYSRLMVIISQGAMKRIRDEMFAHMEKLPVRYFDTHKFGDTMSHYTNDTETLHQMLSHSVPQVFSSIVTIILVFCAMVYTSGPLTILVVFMVIVLFFVMKNIGGRSATHFVRQQKSLGEVNGFIEEMINGQKVVKVFCHEEKVKAEFDVMNDQLCGHATSANKFANIFMPVVVNIGNIQNVLVAISGVGALTLGGIAAFLQLSKSFMMPISQVSQQLSSVVMALAGAERIFLLMDEPVEEDAGDVTLVHARYEGSSIMEMPEYTGIWAWKEIKDGTPVYTKLEGDVQLRDVSFGYTSDKDVLHDVSVYARPGQKVAFVGATGAGKTTITNLINRFYDVQEGEIFYDGINVRRIRKADLRRSLGIVLQDTNLFTGTVRENIRYGKLDATDEEVMRRHVLRTHMILFPG